MTKKEEQKEKKQYIHLYGVYDERTKENRYPTLTSSGWNLRDEIPLDTYLKMTERETVVHYDVGDIISSLPPQDLDYDTEVQLAADHKAEYEKYHADFLPITVEYPPRVITIIGDYNYQAESFAQAFEALGWEVKRVATDLHEPSPKVDIWLCEYHKDPFKLRNAWNAYDADYCLIIQNSLFIDIEKMDIPTYYYAHEGLWPQLPFNKDLAGFFFAYYGAPQQYKNAHAYQMRKIPFKKFVPYAWDPEVFIPITPWEDRPVEFGFMGSLGNEYNPYDVERMDYMSVHMRDLRRRFVPFAKNHCGLEVKDRGSLSDYIGFMNSCRFFFNVSAIFGLVTERQYHAMGMGCVLVQNYFRSIEDLGYADMYNCILYKNEAELMEKMIWAKDHPEECAEIAKNGFELAQRNTYRHRAETMVNEILTHDTGE